MSQTISISQISPLDTSRRTLCLRFAFVYFILLSHLSLAKMWSEKLYQAFEMPWQTIVPWMGKHLFQLESISFQATGSGDTTYEFLRLFSYLMLAAVVTCIWTLADRKGKTHDRLFSCLVALVRLFLGATMIVYGIVKVFPLQFGEIKLHQLLIPYGDSSPMGVLWKFMATSKPYTIFTGVAEVLAGIFLLSPRLSTIGAILSMGVLTNVLMMNLSYDVPVKLFSFHLLLMSLFLISLEWRRIANLLVADGQPLFNKEWKNRTFLIFSISMGILGGWSGIHEYYLVYQEALWTKPKIFLEGIWTIEHYMSDGQERPPLLTDVTRWHRIVFESPNYIVVQKVDGKFQYFDFQIDENKKNLLLGKNPDETWKGDFTFENAGQTLTLTGLLEGQKIDLTLSRMDESQFLLTSRGFHLINEYPLYN